jgi:type II secretory ATPase GspE/PulE/Tfp pilus assembly ATPase PilB-like protein
MPQFESKIAGEIKISEDTLNEFRGKIKNINDFKMAIERFLGEETTELAAALLSGGILLEASDLHIEPEAEQSKLRIRVDGILQDVMFFNQKIYQKLLSRIKLLSGIKMNIADKPQDGRFSIILPNAAIEIRTSTLPAEYGESIVLRLLNPKSLIQIEDLGLREDLLEIFKREIEKPNGMIIVTGPTGSGKTTTLYAFLNKIRKSEIKIITIEDPIEYHLAGISQTQVAPEKGYDFASGLRSIVRQDPDVILVGEIRDLETAQIALQSALTGHLVLTTLHTNDAAGTIARLQALGEKPVNIAPAINVAIAQRLVRKICKKCGEIVSVSPALSKKIKDILKELTVGVKIPDLTSSFKIPQVQARGCQECNFTGYRGRVGIFEAFLIDDELERFILTAPSISDLREKAIKKGMVTMYQDGAIKILEGVTTLEEVERVTGE